MSLLYYLILLLQIRETKMNTFILPKTTERQTERQTEKSSLHLQTTG